MNLVSTESQRKATAKYQKEHYEDIRLRVKKGEKDIIKEHAEKQGESLNAFIKRAIERQIEEDEKK